MTPKDTTSDSTGIATPAARKRWWMFWKWVPSEYRSKSDRLSPEAQGEAGNWWMRGGH